MNLFAKRTEEDVQGGGGVEWVGLPGAYVAEVTSAFDSLVVYPDDKKSRFIGVRGKVVEAIQQDGESSEDFEDRQAQKGAIFSGRIYLTEKTAETAFKLLTEIAGAAKPPKKFLDSVYVDTVAGEPQYNLRKMSETAPINPGQLVGRRFRAALEADTKGGKSRIGLNIFQSWLINEDAQTEKPRDLFEGRDTVSLKIKERIDRKGTKNDSRVEGLALDIGEDSDSGMNDDLPF